MRGLTQFINPLNGLQHLVSDYCEYKIVSAQEKTKRREIEAWERKTLAEIHAKRDILIKFLELSFDERAENFRHLFNVVDQAIESDNNQQLALALHSITELAKSSPFKDLANLASVQAALDDPDHEWVF